MASGVDYEALALEGVKALLTNASAASSAAGTSWKEVKREEKMNLVVFQAEAQKGVSAKPFKAVIEVPFAMEKIVEVVQDFEGRLVWDQNIKELNQVVIKEQGQGRFCAFRSATKAVGPISGRDFVDAIFIGPLAALPDDVKALTPPEINRDTALINGGRGVEAGHPSFPETKDLVRGLNYPGSGWVFEPLSATTCRIHYCVQSQLNGWLPAAVVNSSMIGMFVDFFKCLLKRLSEVGGAKA